MAINIKFDLLGNLELPTIILANRSGNKLGQLKVNEDSVSLADKLNDASEISFTVNKYVDGKLAPLWDKLVDFKLVWCKEWDLWFEVKVELDEETESVKTVFGTQLGQAELSQINLYNVEINTEKDIERDDYKISILYDKDNPEASILNRLLEKAPHYSIEYVDSTIAKIQRTFSFDGISICDAFQEVSQEIGCLFVYNSNSSDGGKIKRTISVYDLQQNCNGCGHRGEFTDKCPKCDSTNIKYGYGKDTLIFVTSDELASGGIHLTTDTDSVKNCFKLEAGDDLMTATVRNCNPNGSDYIWRFSDMTKEDMSNELVEKINSYDAQYKTYYNDYESKLNATLVNKYNSLVTKYSSYNEDLQSINATIKGYSSLMNAYYNTIDLALFLNSGLMPNVTMSGTTAAKQAALLTRSALSPVAINTEKLSSVSLTTADSAVLSMAKIVVRPTYKVEINTSSISSDKKTWTGNFTVTNYSDEEDTATSSTISVTINNNTETFIKQKIDKALNKENTDDYSISGLFKKDCANAMVGSEKTFTGEFYDELKKYSLNSLKTFYDACDSCLDILIEQGASNKEKNKDLYDSLYKPYYIKSSALAAEIKLRESEIAVIEGVWDNTDESNPKLKTRGLQYYIEKCRNTIQNALDFEKYLGEELLREFASYRREDTYSNSNYISDGLNNAELFDKALEFIEVAENEIYKSSELQYSISTSLNNLLALDKFKPLISSFKLGNWIRVQVNDEIYKLRLIEYELDFGSLEDISVEFSDVTKIKNGISDLESVLSQASSIATSYEYTQRQAKQGDNAKGTVDQWLESGLNSALVRIKSNDNEEVTLGKYGLLCRSYDDITDTYSPEQFRLTHNIMAYTTDNWETVSAALGKHDYKYYDGDKKLKDGTDYGLSAKFVTAGNINGSQIIGGELYSDNYTSSSGTYMDLREGNFSLAGGRIKCVVDETDDKKATVTLNDVTIKWDSTNSPSISNITGLQDAIDGKSTVYTSKPSSQRKGDLLIPASTFEVTYNSKTYKFIEMKIYRCTTTNTSFNPSQWVDTIANSAYSLADNAKLIGDMLVDGLGFQETEITGKYIISPVIAGGYLLIGDKTGVYAEISTGGTLKCTGADITGKITATAGEIGGWKIGNSGLSWSSSDANDKTYYFFGAGGSVNFLSAHDKDGKIPFSVSKQGKLTATGADITGELTVTKITFEDCKVKQEDVDGLPNSLDGKSTVYTAKPSSQRKGDLLVPTTTFTATHNSKTYTFTANRIYRCTTTNANFNPSQWADTIANSAYSLADNAKNIGDMLVSGLGFQETEITGQYIISPVIAGGYLLIGDKTGVYAEISTGGTLKCKGAEITGKITSTEGDIAGWEIGAGALVKRDSSKNPKIIISSSGTQSGSYTVGSHTGSDWTIWCNSKFGVTNAGKLYATGAEISGKITATSLTLSGTKVSTDDISGLSPVATSGRYTDLTDRPTIPSSAADLGIDTKNIVYKGDIKQTTKTANGVTYTQTSVPTSSGTVTYDTYDAGDYIVFGGSKGTNSDGKDYICVSKTGLLTARNALIYGTVYATDGEFTGKITASGGEITGSLKVDGMLYHENGDYRVTLRAVRDDKSLGVFYITDNSSGTAKYPFVVGGDGSLKATKATITGDSTFGGKLNAVSGSFTSLTAGKSSFTEELVKIDAGAKSKGAIKIGYTGGSYTDSGGQVWDDITISPSSTLIGNIGTPQYYWDRLCVEKTLNPSDRNLKKDISKMDEKQERFFNLLSPVTYKFIHGTSDRYHYGFISQEVEDAIVESGLTTKDFAGFCKDLKRNEDGSPTLDEDGNQEYIYSLSYTEFIALNTHMIQKVQAENKELKERIDSLEQMIKQLS